jgi:hypothetical protein
MLSEYVLLNRCRAGGIDCPFQLSVSERFLPEFPGDPQFVLAVR